MASQTEAERILQGDLRGTFQNPYGFRIRCRVCNQDEQANTTSHAVTFINDHENCQEKARPNL